MGASWMQDARSGSALSMTGSVHSLDSFLQPYYDTATVIDTHSSPPVFAIKNTKLYLHRLFVGTETWGGVYATLPVSAMDTTVDIQGLKEFVIRICKASQFDRVDELLEVLEFRRLAVSAMIIDHFTPLLGPGLFQDHSSKSNAELEAIESGLARTRTSAQLQHHAYLERRSELFAAIIETPEFDEWKEHQITDKAVAMLNLLSPMVPGEDKQVAKYDLERLIRDCFGIGQQLAVFHREWHFEQAMRGESWSADAMIVHDPLEGSQKKRVEGHAVIRLGIQPSVVDNDYSTGAMVTTEHYRKIVLLMEPKGPTQPSPEKKGKSSLSWAKS